MEYAVVIVEDGTVKVYHSTDRRKLEKEVIRAKEKDLPYAVLRPCEFTTV
ncbi:hypothetical protein [Blautia producta]